MKKLINTLIFISSLFLIDAAASELPVINIPAKSGGDTIAVFFSGDGGWLEIDRVIADRLSSAGIHVIGINSHKYFRIKRTPDETASDISTLLNLYTEKLNRKKVILIGYSFGADVVPFIVNRLSPETRSSLAGAVMLSIAGNSTFLVNADEWTGKVKGEYRTLPEIYRIDNTPLLFIAGDDDDTSITREIDRNKFDVILTEGGHHFGGDYKYLAGIILDWYRK